jgi:hypothetical protein
LGIGLKAVVNSVPAVFCSAAIPYAAEKRKALFSLAELVPKSDILEPPDGLIRLNRVVQCGCSKTKTM